MSRSPHGVAAALVLTFLASSAAHAQVPESVGSMWPGVDQIMAGDSYVPALQEALYGGLDEGESERTTLPLVAGVPFRIVGMCDGDCTDLDLTLYDASGTQIAIDIAIDDTPLLDVEVVAGGTYTLEVAMVTCSIEPCVWSVMAYAPTAALASSSTNSGPSGGDRRTGDLRSGDQTLTSGEFYDEYTIEAAAGSRLVVSLESGDFDPYLIVRSPGGDPFENDDFEGSTTLSRVEVDVTETGTWRVLATSYQAGQTGSYVVAMSNDRGSTGAGSAAIAGATGGPRRESGSLAGGDQTLTSGEFVDYFTVEGRRGEALVVDLTSREFDPYLIVRGPDGEQLDNDDFEGDRTRSLVSLDVTLDGEYTVMVTSYQPGESGAYSLLIANESATTAASSGARVERGTLASGDQTLRSGEYLDEYTFDGRPGQRVRVDVGSSDFDTYVMLIGPGEFRLENDDVPDAPGRSVIEADLTELGTYRVVVTSYAPEETGAYELSIETGAVTAASAEQRDVQTLEPGRSASGRLEDGDGQIENGEFRDLWVFDGVAGQTVTIEMTSRGFDSYLGLLGPSGDVLDENDDADGRTDLSRIEVTLRESGRYRVMATSFAAGQTGDYSLSLRAGTATATATAPTSSAAGERVFGIFAGISDYGGRASNLAYTADDAVRFANAMTEGTGMRAEDAFVLTDGEATTGNIRAAFREIGTRMNPGDRFVFFYSGHGSRVPRAAGPDRADPDGLDETISLYDADITDDEMNDLMALVDGGLSVMVLDACFSGGFSKDVISAPGRIGFFSSEEDVTSQVAAKFRAGGYLALFAADAIGGGYADADGDGAINAIELSQYLHERYRADVKAGGPEDFVRTGGPQSGFQHLVIDRGSIAPFDIVFR